MRSYGQYCGLAKALDLVGDRWTLLIVRELLALGPSRYSDLQHGLPGIATNLLATRLHDMEEVGLVERRSSSPPVPAALFALTERGRALEPALLQLGKWAAPLLGPYTDDQLLRSHWLSLPAKLRLRDHQPKHAPVMIEVRLADEPPMLVHVHAGRVDVRPGSVDQPDALIAGEPNGVLGLLFGRVGLAAARRQGVRFEGDYGAVTRVRPRAA